MEWRIAQKMNLKELKEKDLADLKLVAERTGANEQVKNVFR